MDANRGSGRGSGIGGTPSEWGNGLGGIPLSHTHRLYSQAGRGSGGYGDMRERFFLSVEGSSAAKVNPIPPLSDTNGIAVDWGIPDPNHFGNPIGGG